MTSLKIPFVLISFFITLGSTQNLVNIAEETDVSLTEVDDSRDALGVVYGTRECGGPGHVVQWRIEGCDTTDSPCRFPANSELRRSELDFVPSEDIEQLGLRITVSVEKKPAKTVYERPLRNSTVVGGVMHTMKGAGGISKELQGKNVTIQYMLYRATEQMEKEVCAEADFLMV